MFSMQCTIRPIVAMQANALRLYTPVVPVVVRCPYLKIVPVIKYTVYLKTKCDLQIVVKSIKYMWLNKLRGTQNEDQ